MRFDQKAGGLYFHWTANKHYRLSTLQAKFHKCFDTNCLLEDFHHSPEWCALRDEELQAVIAVALCGQFKEGDVIFSESAVCEGVYYIKKGLVGIRKSDHMGNSTLIKLAYSGDTMGYRPFLAGENHRASAQSLMPTRVCFIPARVMRHLIEQNPALGLKFLKRAARSLGDAQDRFHEAVTLSVRARVAHLLFLLRERYQREEPESLIHREDGSIEMKLPVSRTMLAQMLGVRRESISRVMSELQRCGLTLFEGDKAIVPDFGALRREFDPDSKITH
jgi:CRP-like cAMP-binding protein